MEPARQDTSDYKKELKSAMKKMEQYTPNSQRYKQKKIVQGKVKTKKKTGISKLSDSFLSEDLSGIKNYILTDVIIPALKNTIYDVITNSTGTVNDAIRDGINMILWGDTGHRKSFGLREFTSYGRYYKKDNKHDHNVRNWTETKGYAGGDIILENRGEAEFVLDRMDELVDTYGVVSVADLYDLVGISANYTDNSYGWTDIRSAKVVPSRDGYLLKLPRALPLD